MSVDLTRIPNLPLLEFNKKNASEMRKYHVRGLHSQLEQVGQITTPRTLNVNLNLNLISISISGAYTDS